MVVCTRSVALLISLFASLFSVLIYAAAGQSSTICSPISMSSPASRPVVPITIGPVIFLKIPEEPRIVGTDHPLAFPSEKPATMASVPGDLYIAPTEVTNAQYAAVLGLEPPVDRDNLRPAWINWNEAKGFCDALQKLSDKQFPGRYVIRLPYEFEWEIAASYAHRDAKDWWPTKSDPVLKAQAWFAAPFELPAPVATKSPNVIGLYDMLGNLDEWCEGPIQPNVISMVTKYRQGPLGDRRALRGGHWISGAESCRPSARMSNFTEGRNAGFRPVLQVRDNKRETETEEVKGSRRSSPIDKDK